MKKPFMTACVYACRFGISCAFSKRPCLNFTSKISFRLCAVQLAFALCCLAGNVAAQDSLKITIREADSLFLQNNLQLLAEKYQIDIAKSVEIQDKLWDNPNLSVGLSAYNSSRGVLDVGRRGQKVLGINQMITVAGKRHKQVALDMEATKKTELEFFDLIRTLKFELRQIFFEAYFLNKTIGLLDSQIATLNSTVSAFEKEFSRNNVALKEVVRLKALLFQLTTDRAEILMELTENQRDLKIFTNMDLTLKPVVDSLEIQRYNLKDYNMAFLKDRALQSRTDLKIAQSLTKQAELNYTLQKSLAIPNVGLGAVYDQASDYVNNYFGISASIDLPFFNRNQGNIRGAKSSISYYKTREAAQQNSISNEVGAALQKVIVAENAFKSVEGQFTSQFELLSKGIYENFQKGNISLLEFIDFVETYNESVKQFNRLQSERIKVYEKLNFVVGEELFN